MLTEEDIKNEIPSNNNTVFAIQRKVFSRSNISANNCINHVEFLFRFFSIHIAWKYIMLMQVVFDLIST